MTALAIVVPGDNFQLIRRLGLALIAGGSVITFVVAVVGSKAAQNYEVQTGWLLGNMDDLTGWLVLWFGLVLLSSLQAIGILMSAITGAFRTRTIFTVLVFALSLAITFVMRSNTTFPING